MATKKDLVEAYSFSRRRLVTAFVSGAPGGREVEPSRPGRTIIGGVALAVLLIAGAAVTGVFKPTVSDDWTEPGVVTSKERATNYVIMEYGEDEEPELRPLINTTSAMLLFGADFEATTVPEDELNTIDKGPAIGIANAPSVPPAKSSLIQTGWTACTGNDLGVQINLADTPEVTDTPDVGFLVKDGDVKGKGGYYLIAQAPQTDTAPSQAYRYELDTSALNDTDINDLTGSSLADADVVTRTFLNLFPSGGAISGKSLGLAGRGTPYQGPGSYPQGSNVGDFYTSGDFTYVLTQDGPAVFSDFARSLLDRTSPKPKELDVPSSDASLVTPGYAAANWPDAPVRQAVGEQICGVLHTDAERPSVTLAGEPSERAMAEGGSRGATPRVSPGGGAFVLSGSFENAPGPATGFMIDDRGTQFQLDGVEVPTNLGYDGADRVVVPDSWRELFREGVPLSVEAARCPPDAGSDRACG